MARSAVTLEALPDYAELKGAKAPSKAKVTQLLLEGHQLRTVLQEAEERLKEIKSELSTIQLLNELPGLRYNQYCFMAVERNGRASLSKEKLIDNGVPPEVIAASMTQGSSFVEMRLEMIGEQKKAGRE